MPAIELSEMREFESIVAEKQRQVKAIRLVLLSTNDKFEVCETCGLSWLPMTINATGYYPCPSCDIAD